LGGIFLIGTIFDYKEEGFDDINGLNTMMERIKTILLLQFGINMENIIIEESDISENNLNSIFDKFIEEFKDIYTLFDTFNFYKEEDFKSISLMFKKTIFLATYITICKLLSEEDKLLPIETLRKKFTHLKSSTKKELFTPNRTNTNSRIIFSKTERKPKQNNGKRDDYYVTTNIENYYLYHKILLKSQQIPHIKGERKLISQFCPRTRLFLVNEFKNIAPENLYKKIYHSKNINQLYNELIKYSKIYDKFINSLLDEHNKDLNIIIELLAVESIIPLNLLACLLNKLFEFEKSNIMNDNIKEALLSIINLPKTFLHTKHTVKNYFTEFDSNTIVNNGNINNTKHAVKNYFAAFNSNTIVNNGNINNSNNVSWHENFIKSIQIFSEILFPLISKSFFTFIFSIFRNKEDKIIATFDNKYNAKNNKDNENNEDDKTIITLKYIKKMLEGYLIKNKNIIFPPLTTTKKFNSIKKKFNDYPDYFSTCKNFILNFILNFIQESFDNYKKIDYHSFSLYRKISKNQNTKTYLSDKKIDILTKNIQFYLNNISSEDIKKNENNDMIEIIKKLQEKYHSMIKNNKNKNSNTENIIIKSCELTELIKKIIDQHNEKFKKYNFNENFENKESDTVNSITLLLKNLILIRNTIINSNALKFNHQKKINSLIYSTKINIINQYINYYISDIKDIKEKNIEYLTLSKNITREKIKEKNTKNSKNPKNNSDNSSNNSIITKQKKRKLKKSYSKKIRRFYRRNK